MPWHLIKGIKAWETKPTGYPPGSIPSSYQKHQSSKQLNFPISEVFWSEPPGLFLGKRTLLEMFVLACLGGKKSREDISVETRVHQTHNQSLPDPASFPRKPDPTVSHINTSVILQTEQDGVMYLLQLT